MKNLQAGDKQNRNLKTAPFRDLTEDEVNANISTCHA
jgi:hypothetical protein